MSKDVHQELQEETVLAYVAEILMRPKLSCNEKGNKSSAVAEMGDRGHNRHGPKRGWGCYAPFAEA